MTGQCVIANVGFWTAPPAVRPPAIGYMRAGRARNVWAVRPGIAENAEADGFCRGEVYVDTGETVTAAFRGLVIVLRNGAVADVVVPSLAHLASAWSLRVPIRQVLERQTRACVVGMSSAGAT